MKILIFTQYFWPENFIINDLAIKLTKSYKIDVITGKPNYPKGRFYQGYNFFNKKKEIYKEVTIYRVPIIPRYESKKTNLLINYLSFIFFSFFKFLSLKKNQYKHAFLFAPSPLISLISIYLLKKFLKIKITIWLQDLWPNVIINQINNKFIYFILKKMSLFILENSDFIFVQNNYYKAYLHQQYKIPLKKMDSLYNWSDYEGKLRFLNRENKIKKFIFTGNVGEPQNLDLLVDVFNSQKDNKFILDIYGEGRYKKNLQSKINKLNNVNIRVFPFLSQLNLVEKIIGYDAAIISLSQEFYHTIPLKFQFYLSLGMPILGSIDGEVNDLIKQYYIGFCSKANSHKDFKNILNHFDKLDEFQKNTMAKNSYNLYMDKFNKNFNQKKIINYFNNEI